MECVSPISPRPGLGGRSGGACTHPRAHWGSPASLARPCDEYGSKGDFSTTAVLPVASPAKFRMTVAEVYHMRFYLRTCLRVMSGSGRCGAAVLPDQRVPGTTSAPRTRTR